MSAATITCINSDFYGGKETHIHLFSLQMLASQYSELEAQGLLQESELALLARIKSPQRHREFLYGRAALRHLLASYCDVSVKQIKIERDGNNKPCAHAPGSPYLPVFNVSHSGNVLAIALAAQGQVGIDVELVDDRPGQELQAIARRHFTLEENQRLAAFSFDELPHEFFRLWTLKEAILKAVGIGLYQPLHEVNVAQVLPRYCIEVEYQGLNKGNVQAQHWRMEGGVSLALARVDSLYAVKLWGAD